MSEGEKLQKLLTKAGLSAKRKAALKKLPVAISENGEVKLIYSGKKVKVVHSKEDNNKAA